MLPLVLQSLIIKYKNKTGAKNLPTNYLWHRNKSIALNFIEQLSLKNELTLENLNNTTSTFPLLILQ